MLDEIEKAAASANKKLDNALMIAVDALDRVLHTATDPVVIAQVALKRIKELIGERTQK